MGRIKIKANPYLRLTAYLLLSAVALYSQFIFGDKVLAYNDMGYDTFNQYMPVYEFFASAIKNGTLSEYTFQYGLGSTTFSMIGWISDPFTMINVLVGIILGTEKIAESLVYVQILKILSAGLLTLYYLKQFKFSGKAAMLSAYIYAFSGYMMTAGQHYAFSVFPIYHILLLIMLEKIIDGKNEVKYWSGLCAVTALLCIKGIYTAFISLLGAAFYVLFRVIVIYGKDIRRIFRTIMVCFVFVLGGILLSSALFLPSIFWILESPRIVNEGGILSKALKSFMFAEPNIIKSCILRFFSNGLEGSVNSWSGGCYHWDMFSCFFSVFLVPILAQYLWTIFIKKQKTHEIIIGIFPFLAVVLSIISYFIPSMFNVFVGPSYRFVYVFLPLFAVLTAKVLDNVFHGIMCRWLNYTVMFISCGIICLGSIPVYNSGNETVLPSLFVAVFFMIVGCVFLDMVYLSKQITPESKIKEKITCTASFMLVCIVAMNMFCENYITLYFERTIITKERENTSMVTTRIVDEINDIENGTFFRMETDYHEGRMPAYAYSFLFDMRATSFYNTILGSPIIEFYSKMYSSPNSEIPRIYQSGHRDFTNSGSRSITEDILGLKYFISTKKLENSGWVQIKQYDNGLSLYRNMGIDSAGLFFDRYITEDNADEISFSDRQIGMAYRLVLDNPPSDVLEYAALSEDNDMVKNIAIDVASIGAWQGTVKDVYKNSSGDIAIKTISEKSTSLVIPLHTEFIDSDDYQTQITVKSNSDFAIKHTIYQSSDGNWNAISNISIVKDSDSDIEWFSFLVPKNTVAVGVNLENDCETEFLISSKTVKLAYINEGIFLDNPNLDGLITGTVTAQENCLLYIPIPYSKDWNAYIDGELTEIIKANYAFCAVKMPAGEHQVEFIYKNRLFHYGKIISVVSGMVMFTFFVVFYTTRKCKGSRIIRKIRRKKDFYQANDKEEKNDTF